jgi:SAM-dependent methyltransferase
MVSGARNRVQGKAKYAMVRAEQAGPIELSFEDGSFDVVVANHMLYHTNPTRAVPELARVLRDDGVLVASTNGSRDYAVQLSELSAEVFGGVSASETLEVFSSVTGPPIVGGSFTRVERRDYHDELRCTEPDDVVAWITSGPPAEDASPTQLDQLRSAVQARFDAGGGVCKLTREVCVFLCREPHRAPLSTH